MQLTSSMVAASIIKTKGMIVGRSCVVVVG